MTAEVVIVELAGGLGNQMFQYAAARTVAGAAGSAVVLDVRRLERDQLRKLEVVRWNIEARIATRTELRRFPLWGQALARRLRSVGIPTRYYVEAKFGFDGNLFRCKPPVRLSGYFQSEKYFAAIRPSLLREFVPAQPLSSENLRLADFIAGATSVSVHVRRGDYVTDPTTRVVHGQCSLDYYERAFTLVSERAASDANYFVFSDDIAWAKANIRPPGNTYFVQGNEQRPEVDIYLMSRCSHNICANSTFSWWGAWLNERSDKIVAVPSRWFASNAYDTSHLIPETWVKIP